MKKLRFQQGVSIPAMLGILAVVTILVLTFFGIVRFQIQRTGFEQATITAGYVAEIGFQQIRSQLASANGEWSALPNIENDCTAINPNNQRCQKIPKNAGVTNMIKVRENPLDPNSRVIGVYEATIETGQKRAIFANKTVTGSAQGFVIGSANANEQMGYDAYGNQLCDQSDPDDACPGGFLGIKVTGALTDSIGNILPKTRFQSVYGVLQLTSLDPDDAGPSGYMLESNARMQVKASSKWNTSTWQLDPKGSFYGPLHTNERFEFEWESFATEDVNRNAPANTADDLTLQRPYWGVLMNDIGVQWNVASPRLYEQGTDATYLPYGKIWTINWAPAGAEPAVGSNYEVVFQPAGGGATSSTTVTHSALNGTDYAVSTLNLPFTNGTIVQIKQGATIYAPGVVIAQPKALMDWRVFDPATLAYVGLGSTDPSTGENYRVRYISHSPITVYENMTYSNGVPVYRYWHEHAMTSTWPYYQIGHGHGNVIGANLSTNSTAVNVDPGYDSTTWKHSHFITNDITQDPVTNGAATYPNTFLKFVSPGFAPGATARHEPPLLRPESGTTNYNNQLEQLNKYLQLTLGSTLPRLGTGILDDSQLSGAPYNASNYNQGYIVGKFPSSFPNTTPPTVDFRAVYFGNDLKYTAGGSIGSDVVSSGSSIDTTAWIWVNDNNSSSDYMKVASTQLDANYRRYLYRQIPPGKMILVRDALILIGNMKSQGGTCQVLGGHCLDFHTGFASDPPGQATIVDGQLSIVSFTTAPPTPGQDYIYSKGDIVVVGNVLYHNDFYALPSDKTQMRQLDPQPTLVSGGFTRSNQVAPPITSIADSNVRWITNNDGTRARDGSGVALEKLNGLGLFATHDVKISVTHLANGYDEDGFFCSGSGTLDGSIDTVTINAQLVAGNQVRVHAFHEGVELPNLQDVDLSGTCPDEPPFESQKDSLKMYGAVYSRETPDFASYFRVEREYFFDKSLEKNPLVGAPYYPTTAGDYRNQTVFSKFPKIVQGTWIQGAN